MERARLNVTDTNKIMKRNPVCARCGRYAVYSKRGYAWTIDHFIPFAVAKWTAKDEDDMDLLVDRLNQTNNTVIMCKRCNEVKGCKIESPDQLNKYPYLTKSQQKEIINTYKDLKPKITEYKGLISRVLEKQNGVCYCCRNKLKVYTAIIRRKNPLLPRVEDNACCVCYKCNNIIRYNKRRVTIDEMFEL